jgi:hypothetical protein
MENLIFADGKTACAKILLASRPPEHVLNAIRVRRDEVIQAVLRPI